MKNWRKIIKFHEIARRLNISPSLLSVNRISPMNEEIIKSHADKIEDAIKEMIKDLRKANPHYKR